MTLGFTYYVSRQRDGGEVPATRESEVADILDSGTVGWDTMAWRNEMGWLEALKEAGKAISVDNKISPCILYTAKAKDVYPLIVEPACYDPEEWLMIEIFDMS